MKKLRITIGDKSYDVTVEVLSDDAPPQAPLHATAPPAASAAAAGAPAPAAPVKKSAPPAGGPAVDGAVISPLAGVVISVLVAEGEEVDEGQELIILEAMKMENRITAPAAGKVISIHAAEGQSVPESHVLMVLE